MGIRILSKEVALIALQLGNEVREGKIRLPPEIIAKKKEISEAKKMAHLFIVRVGAVDEGMVNKAVRLMMELDQLYATWAES